jgi:hypothetical protein
MGKFLQDTDEMSMNGVWMVAEPFLGYESLAMAELSSREALLQG